MRQLLGFSLAVTLVVGLAAAATMPDTAAATPSAMNPPGPQSPNKPAPVREADAHKIPAKPTSGKPKSASPVDPTAGSGEQGTPNATVTNGGQLAH